MKVGGHIRKRRQEDELNSEKCGVADALGRLALIGGKTPHNRLSRLCYCKKDLEYEVETVEAGGNDTKILTQKRCYYLYICSSSISEGNRVPLMIIRLIVG